MSWYVWFGYGLAGAGIVGFFLLNIIKQKFITINEAMMLVVLFCCGPAGFIIALIAAIGRIMIEVNSKPNTRILDWRPETTVVECPRCAYINEVFPVGEDNCPKCGSTLLGRGKK